MRIDRNYGRSAAILKQEGNLKHPYIYIAAPFVRSTLIVNVMKIGEGVWPRSSDRQTDIMANV